MIPINTPAGRSGSRCRARANWGISASAKLAHWDRTAKLASIDVPTLVIGARYDTMDPAQRPLARLASP